MEVIKTAIPDVLVFKPQIFGDERGYFFESFSEVFLKQYIANTNFIQDNESKSSYGVLRGLHYQKGIYAQAKLVRVIKGKVLDVAVDIRPSSVTFGQHVAVELSEENKLQLYIPRGFAHGFVTLSEEAIFAYKCDNYYSPENEAGIAFDDNNLAIDWRIDPKNYNLSEKDTKHKSFKNVFGFVES
jgi:dTDP-4-dehydrorhamnose 3,5-epimerase